MKKYLIISLIITLITGCGNRHQQSPEKYVLATTTIAADVVRSIAGPNIKVESLLPVGANPHSFEPTPRDLAKVADAAVIFINGLGLEGFISKMITASGTKARIIDLSEGIVPREFTEKNRIKALSEPADDHDHSGSMQHIHTSGDPHVWFDPNNVIIWTHSIENTLNETFPSQKKQILQNTISYLDTLRTLDHFIRTSVAAIPEKNRKLVTDHVMFGYFADRYGFKQVGAVIPGYNSLAEPSAAEIAHLEDIIRSLDIKAIFVGNTVNPVLSQRIAQDTGTRLLSFYTGSLGDQDSPAARYPDYLRYNTAIIVEGLK